MVAVEFWHGHMLRLGLDPPAERIAWNFHRVSKNHSFCMALWQFLVPPLISFHMYLNRRGFDVDSRTDEGSM